MKNGMRDVSIIDLFLFCLLLLVCSTIEAQPTVKDILPKSPTTASLGKYGDIPLSLAKGQVNASVPLYDISVGDLTLPISLSYNNRGLKVAEIPSWVGHGWDLMAGSMIIRQVNGLPDDCSVGWFAPSTQAKLAVYFNGQFPSTNERNAFLNECAQSEIDTQPDFFSYTIAGKSGKFYFDKNGIIKHMPASAIKVFAEYVPSSAFELKAFRIVDEKGYNYFFELGLLSQISFSPNFPATTSQTELNQTGASAWALTKIVTPTGRIAELVYQNNGQIQRTDVSRVISLSNITDPANAQLCGQRSFDVSSVVTTVHEAVVKEIKFDLGRVEFERGAVRNDITGAFGSFTSDMRSLAAIKVYDLANQLVRKIGFEYEYFGGDKRLKLKRLNFTGSDQVSQSKYEFFYENEDDSYPGFFHSLHGFNAQDYWGFYNGQNSNPSLNPANAINEALFTGFNRPMTAWLGNRSMFSEFAKYGLLNRIRYPTGGESRFEYEPNVVSYGSTSEGEMPSILKNTINSPMVNVVNSNVPNNVTMTVNFTLPYVTDIKVACHIQTNDLQGWSPPTVFFTGPSDIQRAFYNNQVDGGSGVRTYDFVMRGVQPGFYTVTFSTITMDPQHYSAISFSLDYATEVQNRLAFVDGMRISKVSDCDRPESCIIKKLTYETPRGIKLPVFSSISNTVRLQNVPGTEIPYTFSCQSLLLYDAPLNSPLGIEYEHVSEWYGENAENGKTEYRFFVTNQDGFDAEPFPVPTYYSWMSGNLLDKKIYANFSGVFRLVEQETTEFGGGWIANNQFVSIISDNGLKVKYETQGVSTGGFDSFFHTGLTPLFSDFRVPVKKINEKYFYDPSGLSSKMVSQEEFLYENLTHLQLTKRKVQMSDGRIREESFRYAQDEIPGILPPALVAKNEMMNKNQISNVIETIESIGLATVKGERKNYVFSNNVISLANVEARSGNNPYYQELEVTKSGPNGTMLEFKEADGVPKVFLWSHKNSLVIAAITGAFFSEVISALGLTEAQYNTEASLAFPSASFLAKVKALRTNLQQAQVIQYSHKPLVGVLSIIDQNEKTQYFDYDQFGRLWQIRNDNGEIERQFEYRYKHF